MLRIPWEGTFSTVSFIQKNIKQKNSKQTQDIKILQTCGQWPGCIGVRNTAKSSFQKRRVEFYQLMGRGVFLRQKLRV
jgi:hypothetical protein